MNIVIIGTGSIGTRHLRNCYTIAPDAHFHVISRNKISLQEFPNVKVHQSIADLNFIPDAAIVATPTSLHLDSCFELIQKGVKKIYLEKPVSHNLERTDDLLNQCNQNGVTIFVGYDLRFDPGLNKVKSLLDANEIGELQCVFAEVGQYLPDWRNGTDHREGMSAKKELGGGVLLDLIHEFDYINWLAGSFTNVRGIQKQVKSLEIETEAIAVTLFETVKGVVGTITQDYLQKDLSRKAKFVMDYGIIEWDYAAAKVKWKGNTQDDWNHFDYSFYERNDRFVDCMKAFINVTTSSFDQRLTQLSDGLVSLKAVEEAKKKN